MRSVESLINATHGPFWEIGGPSQHLDQRPYINFSEINKSMVCTNHDILKVSQALYKHRLLPREVISTQRPAGRFWRLSGSESLVTNRGWGEKLFFVPELWIDATDIIRGVGELGALYTVALPKSIEPQFFNEAARTLEPGGVLVVENTKLMHELPQGYFEPISDKRIGQDGMRHFAAQRNDMPFVT